MAEPGAQAVAGIILGVANFRRRAERIGYPLGGSLVVGGEAHPHMAVVEDRVVEAIGLFDLVQGLGDQEALQSVPRHESKGALEEVETPKRWKLVKHQQQAVPSLL